MKPTKQENELLYFKNQYEKISDLHLPDDYLRNSNVYVFKKNNKIIGGYILGQKSPLRTIRVFISDNNQSALKPIFSRNQFCEVCCFWISRKYRKSPYLNAKFWLRMANEVRKQNKEYIVFGTNSKGLAKLYDYPEKSILYHKDVVNSKNTYVFLASRKNFLGGVSKIVFSKLIGRDRRSTLIINSTLKEQLTYELSK